MRSILVLLLAFTAPRTPSAFFAPPPTALMMPPTLLQSPSLLGSVGRVLPSRLTVVCCSGRRRTLSGRLLHHHGGPRRGIRCPDPGLAAHGGEDGAGRSHESELRLMLQRLRELNGGADVNPRSPRQVSRLLFGTEGRPTDRATLRSISAGDDGDISSKRRDAAALVLECRDLLARVSSGGGSSVANGGGGSSFASRLNCVARPNTRQASRDSRSNQLIRAANFSKLASEGESDGKEYKGGEMMRDTAVGAPENVENGFIDGPTMPPPAIPAISDVPPSPYDRMVADLFSGDAPSIDPYWTEPLLRLAKSSSRSLVRQLRSGVCPMGYDPQAATSSTATGGTTKLLTFIRAQKARLSDAVLLVRVGDFYESYGVDAVMLVEHCGLNSMAGRARAGCPWGNVQATVDGLTSAGLRVAVYEERPWGTDPGSRRRMKERYLSQVVSSANPTYMHGLVLGDDGGDRGGATDDARHEDSSTSSGRSYVGVLETAQGYTLVEVSAEERSAVVSERLTAEAVSCRLAAYPPADPLIYVPPEGGKGTRSDRLPFLPWRQPSSSSSSGPAFAAGLSGGNGLGRVRVRTLSPELAAGVESGLSDAERAKRTVVGAFLRLDESVPGCDGGGDENGGEGEGGPSFTHEDFVVMSSSPPSSDDRVRTNPLHLETATQLGLMSDPSIPDLVSSLLPPSAPATSRRFLRRWLLVPPPPDVAGAMSDLVSHLLRSDSPLPPGVASAPSLTGRVVSLIRQRQASAAVYRDVVAALDAASTALREGDGEVVRPLLDVLRHDTGIAVSCPEELVERLGEARREIDAVVVRGDGRDGADAISDHGDAVPPAFFERNEAIWRGRVRPSVLTESDHVRTAARALAEAVVEDFLGVPRGDGPDGDGDGRPARAAGRKNPVAQDIFNNILGLRDPTQALVIMGMETSKKDKAADRDREDRETLKRKQERYFHPFDRNGKRITTKYTTERVQDALGAYVTACESARAEVERVLTGLSEAIVERGHLRTILQASHLNLILSTAARHASSSNAGGWNVGRIVDGGGGGEEASSAGRFDSLTPHWMDRSACVANTFDLDGLFLLTAPNMSGKSTLMRSAAAACLLVNSGLCAPVGEGSWVRRFDSLFLRGASADIPTEGKSAFGAEMADLSSLLRSSTDRSLVFVDEIGRGTSPRDGTSLAAAILEHMSERGHSGMFATHLHGILDMPLGDGARARLRRKRMAVAEDGDGRLRWTYHLEDGVCVDSLALLTAATFGLPDAILERAGQFSQCWSHDSGLSADIPGNTVAAAEPLDESTAPIVDNERTQASTTLEDAAFILEDVVGSGTSVHIPQSYLSPPSLEGSSCVYIIKAGRRYYVGETESISRRLAQHRSKGDEWSSSTAVVMKVDGGKSRALNIESRVIRALAKRGFDLISVADGSQIRPMGRRG